MERILEENEKIDTVEKELSSEQDQLNEEMTLLKKKENELQEQVVSYVTPLSLFLSLTHKHNMITIM